MTAALSTPRVRAQSYCPRCGAPVTVTTGQSGRDRRPKLLDPTPQPGGLYRLNQYGVAVRRPVIDMHREFRAGTAVLGGGLQEHAC